LVVGSLGQVLVVGSPGQVSVVSGPDVRNHNSVGVKRTYLHELSFDHSHYGVA
jgi:hypothetical protein